MFGRQNIYEALESKVCATFSPTDVIVMTQQEKNCMKKVNRAIKVFLYL